MAEQFLLEALAMANNYINTAQNGKAIEVVSQVNKIDEGNELASALMNKIVSPGTRWASVMTEAAFGKHWLGEPLDGKSIQVFCDQGMGDTINCLRYLHLMKRRWDCKIVLNCYAYYSEMSRLMGLMPYVDTFTQLHTPCDYTTNILSVPALMSFLKFSVYYPAHWQALLDTPIPPMPLIFNGEPQEVHQEKAFRVGLAHKSNAQNPVLAERKSIPLGAFAQFEDGVNELWSILPDTEKCNIMIQPHLGDLLDTAKLISGLDVVVTVDTVTLHLAGSIGVKTLAILPHEADARWALGPATCWYPSVELFRQTKSLDWYEPIKQVKERLVSLRQMG